MPAQHRTNTCYRTIGFTLIELLSTLAIVGILASVAVSGYSKHVDGLRVNQAVADIERLQLALANFVNRPDRLAQGLPDDLSALGLAQDRLTDPWGRPYQYAANARMNRDYDLFSLGKDGLTGHVGAADDIVRGGNGAFVGPLSDYDSIPGTTSGQLAVRSGSDREDTATLDDKGVRFTR